MGVILRTAFLGALLAGLAGCASFGTETDPARIVGEGPISGYFTPDALQGGPDPFVSGGILQGGAKDGELLSFDVWPFGGFGVGLGGVRARALNFEAAVGTLLSPPEQPEGAVEDILDDL